MIATMFRGIGRVALLLASMAFLAGVSLFVFGSFLLTWPLLRLSPRDRRVKAGVDFASSAMTLLTVFSERSVRQMMEQEIADGVDDDSDHEGTDDDPAL